MWLGLDGEGIGRNPHRYVLLAASDGNGWNDYIEDVRGLSTEASLGFLLRLGSIRKADIAGFYLSYDWTMILKDLPDKALYRLLRPELRARGRDEGGGFSPVKWKDYSIDYLSGAMHIKRGRQSVRVWDVGRYYQCRFVQALEQSGLGENALIARMKDERGSWTEDDLDRVRDYCLEECQALARLCTQLEAQHHAIGLRPRRWHGPGSTAGELLRSKGALAHHEKTPGELDIPVRTAYFGGRFEQAGIGTVDGMVSYDIRSAYPFAASSLPCLAHGKWRHRKQAPRDGAVALVRYRVRDVGARVWAPLPCRRADGIIVWPRGGSSGWVWAPEWQAAQAWKGVEYGREHWELVRNCSCEPFAFLRELYAWRVSRPENKQVVKLALNSVYGKLAQSAGGGSKWSSYVWAGLITSQTRARMLELITAHGDESRLAAIATDGAYSSERLPIAGENFGDWELGEKGRMTFVRPGIYWAHSDILEWYATPDDKPAREAAVKSVRSRGIARRHLLEQIVAAEDSIEYGDDKARLGETVQFGGARECVYLTPGGEYRRSRLYGEWYMAPASLSLRPEPKRDADWNAPTLDGVESAPYVKGLSAEALRLRLIGSLLEGRIT